MFHIGFIRSKNLGHVRFKRIGHLKQQTILLLSRELS
jgi:hypothetical protein